jgi:hypothetical protein
MIERFLNGEKGPSLSQATQFPRRATDLRNPQGKDLRNNPGLRDPFTILSSSEGGGCQEEKDTPRPAVRLIFADCAAEERLVVSG